jgi:hypothetical protein
VLCTYNGDRLTEPMLEGVWRTHPEVIADDAWSPSKHYEDPDHLLRRITPEPTPISDLRLIGFGQDAEEFRERLARELVAEKVSEAKVLDMLLAATEVAKNGVEYGGGVEDVRIGGRRGGFVCEIIDRGPRLRGPCGRISRPAAGSRDRSVGRPAADVADRVLPLVSRIHRATLALNT